MNTERYPHPYLDENGSFKKGNPGGPGRPRGRIDVFVACRERAAREGCDLGDMIWDVMKGLIKRGANGDDKCAKLVLEHLGVPLATGPQIAIDARTVQVGPPIPAPEQLGKFLGSIQRLTGELGVDIPESASDALDEMFPEE